MTLQELPSVDEGLSSPPPPQVYSVADDSGGVLTSPVQAELRAVQERVCKHFLHTHDISVTKVSYQLIFQSL